MLRALNETLKQIQSEFDDTMPIPVESTPPTAIAGVILAAGMSRRMGSLKVLMPFRGKPLLAHVLDAARTSRLAPLCLVIGHRAAEVQAKVDPAGLDVVVNNDYARGQAGSLIAGLKKIRARCRAAMFLLGDQPLVNAGLIDTLIDAHREQAAAITLPVFKGRRGNPVIVAARLFDELERLRGDTGARALFAAHETEILRVVVNDPAVLMDVDCPADYAKLNKIEPAKPQ
jgi:molybdenum cofactor cytidylyltransferase